MGIIETPRLALRELVADDAPFVLRLLTEPSFLQNIGDRGVRDLESARAYIENGPRASYRRHGFGLWHVSLIADGTPIGMCGILKRDTLDDPDIGFAYLPEHWRKGYAWEAAKAVYDYGRGPLGQPRIVAIVSPSNSGSIRVLEKLGLRCTRRLPPGPDGRDTDYYEPQA